MKSLEIPESILRDLYIAKNKTSYEIAELLGCNRSTVNRALKRYQIAINPKQRKFEIIKKIPFSKEQREFLIGALLGDGCIAPHGRKNKSYRFTVTHCEKQKDLLLWKKIQLGNFVNVISKKELENDRTHYSFTSVTHDEFRFFYKLFYENGVKLIRDELINYITPFSLAVWIMDDGHLNSKVNLRLHTEGFTYEDNVKLQYMLKINFDIKSKIGKYNRNGKEYCYLSINKKNTIKASALVEKYFVDCMRYKLMAPQRLTCQTPELNQDEDIV